MWREWVEFDSLKGIRAEISPEHSPIKENAGDGISGICCLREHTDPAQGNWLSAGVEEGFGLRSKVAYRWDSFRSCLSLMASPQLPLVSQGASRTATIRPADWQAKCKETDVPIPSRARVQVRDHLKSRRMITSMKKSRPPEGLSRFLGSNMV